jgi:protein-S-isoprenylcysteine O-methyltransferase Ste14
MTYRQFAQRIRVPAGFILVPLLLWLSNASPRSLIAGSVVAVAGLAIRAWASGCLRKNQELATGGPYAYTRNPLYLGTFLLGAGVAIASGSLLFFSVYLFLYALVYVPVILAEAETMQSLFPESYPAYSREVPLFFPRITPRYGSRTGSRFDLKLYVEHREYRAALGLAAVLAVIAVKSLALAAVS